MASRASGQVALLSIRPQFAKLIMNGAKKVEFRKVAFAIPVSHVVVYATSPVKRILGYFEVSQLVEGDPQHLWEHYGSEGGIDQSDFEAYFGSSSRGVAIAVKKAHRLERPMQLSALGPGIGAPQSFRYLPGAAFARVQRRTMTGSVAAE